MAHGTPPSWRTVKAGHKHTMRLLSWQLSAVPVDDRRNRSKTGEWAANVPDRVRLPADV